MQKIYILLQQRFPASEEFSNEDSSAIPVYAFYTKEAAETQKRNFEQLNRADKFGYWAEGHMTCIYTIEECELLT